MSEQDLESCFICGHIRLGHDAYHEAWGDRHPFCPSPEVKTPADDLIADGERAWAEEVRRHEANGGYPMTPDTRYAFGEVFLRGYVKGWAAGAALRPAGALSSRREE